MSADADDPVVILTRWEDFGGTWRVLNRTGDRVTIALCRCDGGEQVEQLTSDRPDLLAWLGERSMSDQSGTT